MLLEDCSEDLPFRIWLIGWCERRRNRNMVQVHSRFVILPRVKVKNLASH